MSNSLSTSPIDFEYLSGPLAVPFPTTWVQEKLKSVVQRQHIRPPGGRLNQYKFRQLSIGWEIECKTKYAKLPFHDNIQKAMKIY